MKYTLAGLVLAADDPSIDGLPRPSDFVTNKSPFALVMLCLPLPSRSVLNKALYETLVLHARFLFALLAIMLHLY